MRPGTIFFLEVNPKIPPALARLSELAANLWYSWDRPARALFSRLDPQLWNATNHSPAVFLRQIDEERLQSAALDAVFMDAYHRVLAAYDSYHADTVLRSGAAGWRDDDLVAYFCAEFGLHESLPIYSGGLGILAGDHCKAASDMRLPFVGVGLLYREGYFAQTIDPAGGQIVSYSDLDFSSLPVTPVMDGASELRVGVELPGRAVALRVWRARAGHVQLYFLDADVPQNSGEDRGITYRLYGGDRRIRLEQEIVLGMGGARALAALGIRPAVWHINEGHAAFLILERIRELAAHGVDFAAALEAVAANVVFTTHTAVPAGRDRFDPRVIEHYFASYCRELGIDSARLLALGRSLPDEGFDMTALAVRGSRFHNAVSRIHAGVTSRMLQDLWPQIPAAENPIDYVTNGVHVPTFHAPEWTVTLDGFLAPGWRERLSPEDCERVLELPDRVFWSQHQALKSHMLHLVRHRVGVRHFRNQGSESHLERLLKHANPDDPNVLTIGFARRFATYKRASLLFTDLDWLRRIMSEPGRPVLFIFAGKAHPADMPGQDVIREIAAVAQLPEFEGKILLLEGYDLHLSRRLVSGVDVWLNNPVYPLEASGTSGMKAGMNGVINLSVLDGWWGEGYERGNGWAIKPAPQHLDALARDREEARTLYEILQDQVLPLYYARDSASGYSREWVRMAKRSIATLLPRFNATRMLGEYVSKFYCRAAPQARRYAEAGFAPAAAVAAWKSRVRQAWPHVSMSRVDTPASRIAYGDRVRLEVAVNLAGLGADEVAVELLLERPSPAGGQTDQQCVRFTPEGSARDDGRRRYALELVPELCGRLEYYIRAYPYHELLTHRFELGLMVWV